MHIIRSNRHMDQWTAEVSFQEETHYIKYGFRLTDQDGKTVWYNAYGFGRLDVSVAVVDPNDYGGILCVVAGGIGKHNSLFLPLRRRCRVTGY